MVLHIAELACGATHVCNTVTVTVKLDRRRGNLNSSQKNAKQIKSSVIMFKKNWHLELITV
jgi:hypothetical protein